MVRRFSFLFILSLLVIGLCSMTAFAAKAPIKTKLDPHYYSNRAVQYSFPDDHEAIVGMGSPERGLPVPDLGGPPSLLSPGLKIGDTWYDYQHNCRVARMTTWGIHGTPDTMIIHFEWMYLPDAIMQSRAYAYRNWDCVKGTLLPQVSIIQPTDDYAGYVSIDVTDSNIAICGGHETQQGETDYNSKAFWDFGPGFGFFTSKFSEAPNGDCSVSGEPEEIWPSIAYHDLGVDSRTYVFSCNSTENTMQAFDFNVKIGYEETGAWQPSICVDTGSTISQTVCASAVSGRVGLVWTANRPHDGDPDTASANDGVTGLGGGYDQMDNDVYYKTNDYYAVGDFNTPNDGVNHFWNPRVNVTNNQNGVDGYRPYGDLTCMFDINDCLHMVYPARFWPGDALTGGDAGLYRNLIFHYAECLPYVRMVHNANWDQTACNGGAWSMNAHIPTMTECDGKIYVVFVQYNDIPNGVEDDCAEWGHPDGGGDPTGSANGELWMTVSGDYGLTWDVARNLTNTYTPRCGAGEPAGLCDADNWPSTPEFGHDDCCPPDYRVDPSVPPDSPYVGNLFFDVQYIRDVEAGGIVQDEGTWQLADVKWFCVPCVDPIPNPILNLDPVRIAFPAYTPHGVQLDTPLTVTNSGNVPLTYAITEEEDAHPQGYTGWLDQTGFTGAVPSGLGNTETGTVKLNLGGTVNDPGTIVHLSGRLIFTGNAPTSPDAFEIDFWVADTVIPPIWDTIFVTNTADTDTTTALVLGSGGNFGNQGPGEINMDYYNYGDCDDDEDSPIEGDSRVYLYDGSPLIGWLDGDDTTMYWNMFGHGWLSENSYRAVGEHAPVVDCDGAFEVFASGVFVTGDSSIAMKKYWFAPHLDGASFVVQCLKVWSFDGEDHPGMIIGEGIDFDIPSDTASYNDDGMDPIDQYIYQIGLDLSYAPHTDDTMLCQRNSDRYGGIQFVHAMRNDTMQSAAAYGAYVAENDSFVYGNDDGFEAGELYQNMSTSGWRTSDSTEDLHTVMTYMNPFDLNAGDQWKFTTVIATIEEGSSADLEAQFDLAEGWCVHTMYIDGDGDGIPDVCDNCPDDYNPDQADSDGNGIGDVCDAQSCCNHDGLRGDVNFDNAGPNIVDLTYLVAYLFGGGPTPPCLDEANVNGDASATPNIVDLTWLVAFLFGGGPPPAPCP